MQKDCATKRHEENDADESVGGKESGVQPSQIVRADEVVLIDQQSAGGDHAGDGDRAETADLVQCVLRHIRACVKRARDP